MGKFFKQADFYDFVTENWDKVNTAPTYEGKKKILLEEIDKSIERYSGPQIESNYDKRLRGMAIGMSYGMLPATAMGITSIIKKNPKLFATSLATPIITGGIGALLTNKNKIYPADPEIVEQLKQYKKYIE